MLASASAGATVVLARLRPTSVVRDLPVGWVLDRHAGCSKNVPGSRVRGADAIEVTGFLLKDARPEDLVSAVRLVAAGEA